MLAINTSTRADIQCSSAIRTRSCFVSCGCCACSFLSSAQIAPSSARSITAASRLYAPLASRWTGYPEAQPGGRLASLAKLRARRPRACNPPALRSDLPCLRLVVRCTGLEHPATPAGRLLGGPELLATRTQAWDGVRANHTASG